MSLANNINVCILNYGSGNVKSVYNLLKSLVDNVKISNSKDDIEKATHFILPGVGAYGTAMEKIRKIIPIKLLEHEVFINKKPFLGICIGMHSLANKGFEFGEFNGLGWIDGEVTQLNSGNNPLPHIGWNNFIKKQDSPILKNIDEEQNFYFVHSFVFRSKKTENIVAETEYGENFVSIVQKDNIFGVQFHPEKSQNAGKLLIKNFLALNEKK
jgi:glutamine amidotransferase